MLSLSVNEMCEEVAFTLGIRFQRDPLDGKAWLKDADWAKLRPELREALKQRWGDVEALLNEQAAPRHMVPVRCAGELLGIDYRKDLPPAPKAKI